MLYTQRQRGEGGPTPRTRNEGVVVLGRVTWGLGRRGGAGEGGGRRWGGELIFVSRFGAFERAV
jgi:hypothetical protein